MIYPDNSIIAKPENAEPPAATVVIPYVTQNMHRLQTYNNIKPASDQQYTQECIYQISCQCDSVYIWETAGHYPPVSRTK
ncbi:hypothetical protein PR048_026525, partial [Dryococelus australis]